MGIQGFPFAPQGMPQAMSVSTMPMGMPQFGMPQAMPQSMSPFGMQASPFGAQSPMFPGQPQGFQQMQGQQQGMPGGMPGDVMSMFMSITTMMLGVLTMITGLLAGILSGAISGQTPAGGTTPGGSGPGTTGATGPGGQPAPVDGTTPSPGGTTPGASTDSMQRLAQTARTSGGAMNKPGWCLGGVQTTLRAFGGPTIPPLGSAYRAADYMAGHPDQFEEVKGISASQLKSLGPGYIVVYERGGSGAMAEHGHIYITLGGGKEASSTTRDIFMPPNGFRVFKLKG